MNSAFEAVAQGRALTRAQALGLLEIPIGTPEYTQLLALADDYARTTFDNKGVIFAQLGLDAQGCSIDCKFCTLAESVYTGCPTVQSLENTVERAKEFISVGVNEVFLMTTAEFGKEDFLRYAKAVRAVMPEGMGLVANVGDFDVTYAKAMKEAGITGVYHVHRLGEGVDTGATTATRIRTMDAVRDGGLTLYYCVEPIGPEHTHEELVDEMMRIEGYPVEVMAVMKRIAAPGTPMAERGEVDSETLAKICAVTTLVARPARAMCVHEPDALCLKAGANQLYAECGTNPRDVEKDTACGRGYSVATTQTMLKEAGWQLS